MKKNNIYIISLIIFIIDLIVKEIVINNINKEIKVIKGFFSLCNIKNTGGAFSILNNNIYILIIVSLIFLVFIVKYINNNKLDIINSISISFVLGGLIANLYDRIIRIGVIDYLSFNLFGYYFPVFNIADIFITIGIFLIIIKEFWGEYHEYKS